MQGIARIGTLGAALVDLVLGQPNKASAGDNAGEEAAPNDHGFASPLLITLDRVGNLYVIDSSYEGGLNRRVLRFSAASVDPATHGGDLFPLPPASGVYAKTGFDTLEDWGSGTPAFPVAVAFDSQNRMLLSVDSYGNVQNERLFVYDAGHAEEATPQPAYLLPVPLGQGAIARFDPDDRHLILEDHTWQRVLFLEIDPPWEPNPPLVLDLGLGGPNPALGELVVWVTPGARPATLEIFDVSGRRLHRSDIEPAGTGAQVVRPQLRGRAPSRIYLLRLKQGSTVRECRVVLLR